MTYRPIPPIPVRVAAAYLLAQDLPRLDEPDRLGDGDPLRAALEARLRARLARELPADPQAAVVRAVCDLRGPIHRLDVDYDPCPVLLMIGRLAGIPARLWPRKSTVELQETQVLAKFGYGQPWGTYVPLEDGRVSLTTETGTTTIEPWNWRDVARAAGVEL